MIAGRARVLLLLLLLLLVVVVVVVVVVLVLVLATAMAQRREGWGLSCRQHGLVGAMLRALYDRLGIQRRQLRRLKTL
jgi:hypothetical protein